MSPPLQDQVAIFIRFHGICSLHNVWRRLFCAEKAREVTWRFGPKVPPKRLPTALPRYPEHLLDRQLQRAAPVDRTDRGDPQTGGHVGLGGSGVQRRSWKQLQFLWMEAERFAVRGIWAECCQRPSGWPTAAGEQDNGAPV